MAQMVDNFPERDVFYGVEQACPGPSGLRDGLGEMIRAMLPNMDDDILAQQRMVCMRLVQAENSRYNETARMLRRMVQYQRDYQTGIETQRASVGESQGALAANDNETSRFIARMQMDREYWVARDRAWGTYIETLRRDHGRLARRALEGNKDESLPILGKLVEAAALKAALDAGR